MRVLSLFIILLIFTVSPAESKSGGEPVSRIEITGNWHGNDGWKSSIQTREPELGAGEVKTFMQELKLSEGNYTVSFEYEPQFDKDSAAAFGGHYNDFRGFKINGKIYTLNFSPVSADRKLYRASCNFKVEGSERTNRFTLSIHNTRVIRTWLEGSSAFRQQGNFFSVNPAAGKEFLLVHQIPFLARKTDHLQYGIGFNGVHPTVSADRGALQNAAGKMLFNLDGTRVKKMHFLGMIHKVDIANGSWYAKKNDHGYSHFIGDKAGDILITYQDNRKVAVPLIFGVNLWYGRAWDMLWFHYPKGSTELLDKENFDKDLFGGDREPRKLIENTILLSDGTRLMGSRSSNTRFIFTLDMGNMPVKSVEITGSADMYGHPLISAITAESSSAAPALAKLPDLGQGQPVTKPVTVAYMVNEQYKPAVEKLKRAIYSFKDELPALKQPEIPAGYFGPKYDFKGTQEAVYAATYLYRNGPECGAKIADDGTTCSSTLARSRTLRYVLGTGIWIGIEPLFGNIQNWFSLYQSRSPGQMPGAGNAWSRGIGELMREAMAFGYGKFINSYTDWLDNTLLTEANPPHWIRIAGKGKESGAYTTRKVGDIIETGNRENDGHGICMMGRYMAYHWQGHPASWNEKHWEATRAAVNWIQWQQDTDMLFPGKRIDMLYTESESGNYEFYASYNCLHGLLLSIKMAHELGKTEEVAAWTKLYDRLRQGILDHAVRKSQFGPIWYTNSHHWMDEAHKLAHIQLATDGITYTPLEDYAVSADPVERKYLEIDRNTYRYLLKDKNYNCLRMYGYGQGMMTQSALLMDEMGDAENFINMMVNHCYLPKMEGWAAPEGIMLHKSGEFWIPVCGYLGQDSHLADSQKALRLMLGIDDNNPDNLRLVPRYPSSWNKMSISDFPVLTGSDRQNIAYNYIRDNNGQTFSFSLRNPVKSIDIRLGPVLPGRQIAKVMFNGKNIDFKNLRSGDSQWVWVKGISGVGGEVRMQYE